MQVHVPHSSSTSTTPMSVVKSATETGFLYQNVIRPKTRTHHTQTRTHGLRPTLAQLLRLRLPPLRTLDICEWYVLTMLTAFPCFSVCTCLFGSGCTAVAVLIRDGHMWIANAGDSRAILAATASGSKPSAVKVGIHFGSVSRASLSGLSCDSHVFCVVCQG